MRTLTFSSLILALALTFVSVQSSAQNTCASAINIPSLPYSTSNTTCGKVNDYTATGNCGGAYMGGEDIVYKFTPSVSTCINLSTSGTGSYTGLFVLNACPNAANASNCIAKNEASGGNPSLGSVAVQAGITYYIIIDTWPSPNCTAFNLNISECPAGSTCSKPRTITSLPFSESNTTCGAGADFGTFVGTDYANCGPNFNDDGADFVYAYTAPQNQCINVSLSGIPSRPEETAIIVSSGCPTSASSKCLGVSEGSGSAGPAPLNGIFVFAGSTIYITIDADDFYYACTPFTINIDTCNTSVPQCNVSTPAGDFCSNAVPVCDLSGYCGSTSSSYTPDTPGNINSVFCGSIENNGWIKFVASASTASFNVYHGNCSNGDGIQALVLESNNCSNFTVKSNCYEPLTATGYGVISATGLTPGNTYLIMIDGYAGDQCDYVLSANSGVLLPVDAGPDRNICPGQSVTLTATQGNGIYSWQPGGQNTASISVSPTTTTSYVVSSLSGSIGCPSPNYDTVIVTVTPTVLGSITNVVLANACSGSCDGSASFNVSNGDPPYTIAWNTGANTANIGGLCPGSTYTAMVTDASGCKAWDTLIMPPAVNADFSLTTPACGSLSATASVVSSSGTGAWSYTGPGTLSINNAGSNTFSITASAYGSYQLTYTVSNGSCTRNTVKTLNFRAIPSASFTFINPSCGSKNTSLSTSGGPGNGSFTYTGPGALTFTSTGSGNYDMLATSFGSYSVTYTVDNQGCTASATQNISFTAQPVSTFSISGPLCDSLKFTANTTASPGSGAWSYTSSSGTLVMSTLSANSFSGSVSNYGSYTLTWTVTNGACSATSSQNLSFYKKPLANGGPDRSVCSLGANLAGIASSGTGQWTQVSGPGTISFGNPSSATSLASASVYGVYLVRWTETNGNCPASADDVQLTFSQAPAGNAGPDQSVCGLSTNLNGIATLGTGTWSGSGVVSPSNPNTQVNSVSQGTITYTWTITNGVCPPLSDQVLVSFYSPINANAGADQSICGLSTNLDAVPPLGSGVWQNQAGISFSSLSNPKSGVSTSSYGTFKLVWEESNGPCPISRDTVQISFIETPSPDAGSDFSVCGLSANLNAANSAFSGSWTGPGALANPSGRSTTVNQTAYGTFSYVWTEYNASPCPSKSDTVKISFIQKPMANGGPDKVLCGLSTNLTASPSVSGASGSWSGPAQISFSSPNTPNTGVSASAYGTYWVYWTESNGSVCPSSKDTVRIEFVSPSNPSAGPDKDICGLSSSLDAVPSFGLGSWSYTGPGILSFNSINDPNALISASQYGVYRLAWTEDNKPCVANTDTVIIRFFESPTVDAGATPDKVCGLSFQLSAAATVGKGKWTYAPAPGTTGTLSFKNGNDSIPNAVVDASDYGRYFLIWDVINGACTPPSDTVDLTFWERPTPDAGPDQEICDTLRVQLNGITTVSGQWSWSAPAGGNIQFLPDALRSDPIAEASMPGLYTLYFHETNDPVCGIVTDSLNINFLEQPRANAGPDDLACGINYILAAQAPSVGTGKWRFIESSDPGYSVTFDNDSLFNTQVSLNTTPPAAGVVIKLEWTLSNGSCPTNSDTVEITFKEVPNQVEAGPNQVLCGVLNTTLNANDNGASGTWNILAVPVGGSVSLGNPSDENTAISVNKSGTYVLEREATVAGCPNQVSDIVTLDFRTQPNPNAGPDDSICDKSYTLAANALVDRITGVWELAAGPGQVQFSSPTQSLCAVQLVDSVYGTYTFRRRESNLGCADASDLVQITFRRAPLADAGISQDLCGLVQSLGAIPSAASSSPAYQASWTGYKGPGNIVFTDSTLASTNIQADAYGLYTFYWTESNGLCPSSTDSVKLNLVNPSNPNAGPDHHVCGLQDTLAAIPSYGSGTWITDPANPGAVSFVNPADPKTIVTADTFGIHRFDWLEANSPCFANSDFTLVHFNKQPMANAGQNRDTCGLSIKLNATPSASGPDYIGTWSGPLGAVFSNINDPKASVDVSSLGYGSYTFTWTEINGTACAASVSQVQIGFIETPLANPGSYPSDICGRQLKLNAIPSVGSGVWSLSPDSGLVLSNNISPSSDLYAQIFGTYTLSWTETNYGFNGGQCKSSNSLNISFHAQPSAYAGKDTAVCGDLIKLNASRSVAGSTLMWQSISLPILSVNPSSDSTAQANAMSRFGSHLFVLREENAGLCISTDTLKVNFVQQAVANAGVPDSICGLTAGLLANPSVGNGFWRCLESGVSFSPGIASPNPAISVTNYGLHHFIWTEDNGLPCLASADTVSLSFFEMPIADAGPDISVCGDSAMIITASNAYDPSWETSGANQISFKDSLSFNTGVSLKAGAPFGTYALKLKLSNASVCSATDELNITFAEAPMADAGPDTSFCGRSFTLQAGSEIGSAQWQFVGNENTLNQISGKNSPSLSGESNLFGQINFLRIADNGGVCPKDSDLVSIQLVNQPLAQAGPDQEICGNSTLLDAIPSVGLGEWSVVSGPGSLNFTDKAHPKSLISSSQPGTYTLRWTENNGSTCPVSSDELQVYFETKTSADAGLDQEICGLEAQINSLDSGPNGLWQSLHSGQGTLQLSSANQNTSSVQASSYGVYYVIRSTWNTTVCPSSYDTVQLRFVEQPVATVSQASLEICGQTATLTAIPSVGTGSWSQVSGPGIATILNPFSPSTQITISENDFGDFLFRWTEDNGSPCLSSSADVSVRFEKQAQANAGVNAEFCGLSGQLSAIPSVGSAHWYLIPSGSQQAQFSDQTSPNSQVQVNEYGTYFFAWEEQNGQVCPADQSVVSITFFEAPVSDAGPDLNVCGLSAELTGQISAGQSYWTIVSPPGAASLSDSTSLSTTIATSQYGSLNVVLTALNGKVCQPSFDTISITFYQAPVANAGPDLRVCGLEAPVKAINSIGIGTWSSSGTNIQFLNGISSAGNRVQSSQNGSFPVVWTEKNGMVCPESTDTLYIEFIKGPSGQLSVLHDSICLGSANQLVYTGTGIAPFVLNYTENGQTKTWNNVASADTLSINPSQNTVYQLLSVTDASGLACAFTGNSIDSCIVLSLPSAQLGGQHGICSGSSAEIPINFSGNAPFVFTLSDGSSHVSNSPYYNYTYTPGAGILYVSNISDRFCVGTPATDTAFIESFALPQALMQRAGNTPLCSGDSVALALEISTGKAPFDLTFSPSDSIGPLNLSTSTGIAWTRSLTPGNHWIVLDQIRDANGCLGGPDSVLITINPRPAVNLSANSPICRGDQAKIQLLFSPNTGGPWQISYSFGLGSNQIASSPLQNPDSIVFTPLNSTNFVGHSLTDLSSGCKSVLSNTSIALTVLTPPDLNMSLNKNELCFGDSLLLNLRMSGQAPFSLKLSNGDSLSNVGSNYSRWLTPDSSGTLKLTAFRDASGLQCGTLPIAQVQYTVNPLPAINFMVLDSASCAPLAPVLINTSAATDVPDSAYSWVINGKFYQEREPQLPNNLTDSLRIELSATTIKSCTSNLARTVALIVYPDPTAGFEINPEQVGVFDRGTSVRDASFGAARYRWTINGDTVSQAASFEYYFANPNGGAYTLCQYLESDMGCKASLCKKILIPATQTLYVPNAFTPDDDGINDQFKPVFIGIEREAYEFLIFDRWGEIIFKTNNPDQAWDGTYMGRAVQTGVYTWKIHYRSMEGGEFKSEIGQVQLLR